MHTTQLEKPKKLNLIGISLPKIMQINPGSTKLLQKIKRVQFFLKHSVVCFHIIFIYYYTELVVVIALRALHYIDLFIIGLAVGLDYHTYKGVACNLCSN